MDKISVIVAVYNVDKYIHRCLNSILQQTYKNLEVILVDDGSTDDSGKICDYYREKDPRVVVIHKDNGGQSSARNVGIEIVSGDYIAFVDSDDWIANDMYDHMIKIIKDTNSDVANVNYVLVEDDIEYRNEEPDIKIFENKEILRQYLLEGTIRGSYSFCRNLYKKELFEFIRFPIGKINEDIATNYKVLMKVNRMVKSNYVGYFYFQDSTSTTRGAFVKRDFDLLDACKELEAITQDENYSDIKYLVQVKYVRSYFSLLAKIAFYGIKDKDLNQKEIIKGLTKELRQNYFLLMGSPIPLNRKLMATALSINFSCLALPLRLYKIIKRK